MPTPFGEVMSSARDWGQHTVISFCYSSPLSFLPLLLTSWFPVIQYGFFMGCYPLEGVPHLEWHLFTGFDLFKACPFPSFSSPLWAPPQTSVPQVYPCSSVGHSQVIGTLAQCTTSHMRLWLMNKVLYLWFLTHIYVHGLTQSVKK